MALSELIKYEGDNSTFIWKYPHEDFNNMTELIVYESQEAIFFAKGSVVTRVVFESFECIRSHHQPMGKR